MLISLFPRWKKKKKIEAPQKNTHFSYVYINYVLMQYVFIKKSHVFYLFIMKI